MDAGWEESGSLLRGRMVSPDAATHYTATGNSAAISITEDTGNQAAHYQFVSGPLTAGTTFTSGVTTVKMQAMMREFGGTDDLIASILGLRVVSLDGSTVRATLLAVASYGNDATEFSGDQPQRDGGRLRYGDGHLRHGYR